MTLFRHREQITCDMYNMYCLDRGMCFPFLVFKLPWGSGFVMQVMNIHNGKYHKHTYTCKD